MKLVAVAMLKCTLSMCDSVAMLAVKRGDLVVMYTLDNLGTQ